MEWYQILMVIGIPGIISGIISGICMMTINRTIAKGDEEKRQADEARKVRDYELKKQNDAMEKQNKAMMAGLQAMLRDRLLQGYRHYDEKGWADYADRMNLENIYEQYHNLGANGVMDGYREKFLQLPTNE